MMIWADVGVGLLKALRTSVYHEAGRCRVPSYVWDQSDKRFSEYDELFSSLRRSITTNWVFKTKTRGRGKRHDVD